MNISISVGVLCSCTFMRVQVCLKRLLGVSVSGRVCECVKDVPQRHLPTLIWPGEKAGVKKEENPLSHIMTFFWVTNNLCTSGGKHPCMELSWMCGVPLKSILTLNPSASIKNLNFKTVKVRKTNSPYKILLPPHT